MYAIREEPKPVNQTINQQVLNGPARWYSEEEEGRIPDSNGFFFSETNATSKFHPCVGEHEHGREGGSVCLSRVCVRWCNPPGYV